MNEQLRLHAGVLPAWFPFFPPDVNTSRWNFASEEGQPPAIRVPLRFIKSITAALLERNRIERARAPFASLRDFYQRGRPTGSEMLNLVRAGAFDGFDEPRTTQFVALPAHSSPSAIPRHHESLFFLSATFGNSGSAPRAKPRRLDKPLDLSSNRRESALPEAAKQMTSTTQFVGLNKKSWMF